MQNNPLLTLEPANQTKGLVAWSLKQWLGWLSLPILGLGLWWALLVWIQPEAFTWSKDNYWPPQVPWFIDMNQAMTAWPSWVWYNLTRLGDGLVILPLVLLFTYYNPQVGVSVWTSVPIAAVFSGLGKSTLAMPRPATVLEHDQFTIIGETVTANTSLPSGHSLTYATAMFAVLAVLLPKPQTILSKVVILVLLGVLSILCLSRVAVGAHWPLDTLAGASLGALSGLLSAALTRRGGHHNKRWWHGLYTHPWRFCYLPIFALWFYLLSDLLITLSRQQSHLSALDMITIYAALGACVLLMYWPFSARAKRYKNIYIQP